MEAVFNVLLGQMHAAEAVWILPPMLAAALLLTLVWSGWRWGVVPMPTTWRAQKLCVEVVREQLGSTPGVVTDLGSGFGSLALALARGVPHAQVHAIEGNHLLYSVSRLLGSAVAVARRQPRVNWARGDFMTRDLRHSVGVFCYLYPGIMPALAEKLRAELQPGAWIVSNTFALPGWKPEAVLHTGDALAPVYLYRMGADAPPIGDAISDTPANPGSNTSA